LTLAVGLLALAGCGSSSSTTSSSATTPTTPAATPTATAAAPTTPTTSSASTGASQTLALEANAEGQLKYNKTSLTANAGKVSIDFTNKSPLGHNMTIESASGETVGATPTFQGGSKTLSVELMAGMEGTLTVK
jgi:plastocyanin